VVAARLRGRPPPLVAVRLVRWWSGLRGVPRRIRCRCICT
jgi:hypothetical protein